MSVDVGTGLEAVRPWISTGILSAILFFLVRFAKPIADYLIEMRKLRLQEKGDERGGYGDLIDRLIERVDRLEGSEERCKQALAEALNRIAQLEGYNIGQGRASQEAAGVVAADRLDLQGPSP